MEKKIGIGIVGLGIIADFHARAIVSTQRGKLVACCSSSPEKLKEYNKKYNCRAYTSFDDLLKDPEVDIVSICTPSGLHIEYALKTAKMSKHIIVEKPLEVTIEKCDEIIHSCEKNNVKLACVFQSRYFDTSMIIAKAIKEKRFGKLIMGNAYVQWFRSQEYYDSGAWRGTKEIDGGGALMNQSIHAIDLLQWYMGEVDSVKAFIDTRNHKNIDVEDNAVAAVKFTNGALGTIQGSTCVYPGFQKKIEIFGSEGHAILEEDSITSWCFKNETEVDQNILKKYFQQNTSGGANDPKNIKFEAHRDQYDDFINSIIDNKEYMINGSESRKSVEIIQAIYESSKTGKEVKLPL